MREGAYESLLERMGESAEGLLTRVLLLAGGTLPGSFVSRVFVDRRQNRPAKLILELPNLSIPLASLVRIAQNLYICSLGCLELHAPRSAGRPEGTKTEFATEGPQCVPPALSTSTATATRNCSLLRRGQACLQGPLSDSQGITVSPEECSTDSSTRSCAKKKRKKKRGCTRCRPLLDPRENERVEISRREREHLAMSILREPTRRGKLLVAIVESGPAKSTA